MSKNVFIISPEKYGAIFAKYMMDENLWNPKFFLSGPNNSTLIKEYFPDAINHSFIDAVKGIPIKGINNKNFDLSLIESLKLDITIPLSLLDRNDSNTYSFTYKERLFFCYNQITYWANVLINNKIDLVFFQEEPHQSSIYILYKVAQHLGIETPMVIRTIADLGLIPSFKFEKPNSKLLKLYDYNISSFQKTGEIDLDPGLREYLNKLSGNYEDVLKDHLWDQVDTYEEVYVKGSSSFNLILKYFKFFLKRLIAFKKIQFQSDQKESKKSFRESKLSYYKYQYYRFRTIFRKRRLYKYYQSLASSPDNLGKYVLCALQYQPEKSTCPLGGEFNEQRLMIKSLRASLPEDVTILVKEHPSQFIYDYARYGEYFRDLSYYKSILEIPNVELVDMKTNIFEYIDNALFVASVTGTICWEAVNRKVPALCFGNSWMAGCEGIYVVNNASQLEKSIKEVLINKKNIDVNSVHLFAKTIFDLNFNAAVGGTLQLKRKGVSDAENAKILRNAIVWLGN